MAKESAHESEDEQMEQEEEYEVKRIKKHRRTAPDAKGRTQLFYTVAWVGYPDGDTEEPEENVNETAMEKIDEYWEKVDPKKRFQRFPPNTAKGKAEKKRASRASEASSTPAKRGRSSTAHTQHSDDETAAAEKPSSKRKARQSSASVASASASKKSRKSVTAEPESDEEEEAEVVEKPTKKAKKAKEVEIEEEQEEEPAAEEEDEEIAEGEGYDGGREYKSWEDLEYADKDSWEDVVDKIETVEQEDGGIKFHINWKELENIASWVPNQVCKERCPLKLLEFYENHLKFQAGEDTVVDGSAQEDN